MESSQTLNLKPNESHQMDVEIDKQLQLDAEEAKKKKEQILKDNEKKKANAAKRKRIPFLKRLFSKKQGPMGITDITKRPIRLNISEEVKKSLFILAECLIIGFLLNIFFHNFRFSINLLSSIGWGIGYWIIKFKLPPIIRSYK